MNDNCIACGMPLENEEDLGVRIDSVAVCKHCVDVDGKMKSCQEIFDGGVEFFMGAVPGITQEFAEKIVRKNMNSLPYWQAHPCDCCQGAEATDEEFKTVLGKL